MRLRYQLVVALLVMTLMVTSFMAGRQFQSLAALVPGKSLNSLRLLSLTGTANADQSSGNEVTLRPIETFQEVLSHVRKQYVSPVKSDGELTYGAVRGMLSVLRDEPYNDRYSRFMDPEEYRSFLEENEGHFGGIGAELGVREVKADPAPGGKNTEGIRCPVCGTDIGNPKQYQVVIIAPLPDSPAERVGLRAGDHILRVDDVPTAALTLGDTVRRIKGAPGTSVSLVVGRVGLSEPLQVKVTRAIISVRSAEHKMLPDHVGYLRISTFNDTTTDMVKKALKELRDDGMQGLLLDLRNDPGGGLETCIEVASQFVGKGTVVYIQERNQPRQPREATTDARHLGVPLVVLVNNGSASASEILAGAIQDDKAGKLMGVTTFGKGLVQTVFPLRDGSALALTTARYLTPKLRDIDHKGIAPDIAVEQTKTLDFIQPLSEKDVQATSALSELRQEIRRVARAS